MCIFCKIINHEIPSSVVFEDEKTLAILDISQVTRGHTLVMPKKHVANILEADAETVAQCAETVRRLSRQIVENTGARGCNILNNTNEVAGQTVNHLHFHIIPRYDENDAVVIAFNESAPQDLETVARTIRGE